MSRPRAQLLGMEALIEECQRLRCELRTLSDENAQIRQVLIRDGLHRGLAGAQDGETLEAAIARLRDERNQLRERLVAMERAA